MSPLPLFPAPAELELLWLEIDGQELTIHARTRRLTCACPACGVPARRVHSRYTRTLADLPWHGTRVRLRVQTRRFFCRTPACPRRIFAERLPATTQPYARRTLRLTEALRAIGFALGGTPGARLAIALGLKSSPNTLLRRIREEALPDRPTPWAVGVDDYAFRKGRTYGTIVLDLERGYVLDLLPDRTAETLAAWLRAHPGIEVISRDRAGAYAEGARHGAPDALQVADRLHLVKNLGEAVERILRGHGGLLRETATALASHLHPTPPPREASREACPGPQVAELRASAESRARRLARYQEVMALRSAGASLEEISASVGVAVTTVHRWVHADGFPERAKQRRGTDPVVGEIRKRWEAGCHNAAAIWRALAAEGFSGSKRTVQREVAHLGLSQGTFPRPAPESARPPSPRHLAWLFGREETAGSEDDQALLRMLCTRSPELARVRELAQRFVAVLREHDVAGFEAWLQAADQSELRGFVRSLLTDSTAVRAAVSAAWSNGPTEGHVNRLKTIKRSMYGRAGFTLLKARVLHAA